MSFDDDDRIPFEEALGRGIDLVAFLMAKNDAAVRALRDGADLAPALKLDIAACRVLFDEEAEGWDELFLYVVKQRVFRDEAVRPDDPALERLRARPRPPPTVLEDTSAQLAAMLEEIEQTLLRAAPFLSTLVARVGHTVVLRGHHERGFDAELVVSPQGSWLWGNVDVKLSAADLPPLPGLQVRPQKGALAFFLALRELELGEPDLDDALLLHGLEDARPFLHDLAPTLRSIVRYEPEIVWSYGRLAVRLHNMWSHATELLPAVDATLELFRASVEWTPPVAE